MGRLILVIDQKMLLNFWGSTSLAHPRALHCVNPSLSRIHTKGELKWINEAIRAVVLKLFQDEAHLCKVNYFVAPQKKTHDENILLQ